LWTKWLALAYTKKLYPDIGVVFDAVKNVFE
jgi:hypothetical protein